MDDGQWITDKGQRRHCVSDPRISQGTESGDKDRNKEERNEGNTETNGKRSAMG